MNPLLLTMSHLVGILTSSILTCAAAFTPYIILIVCLIGLLVLACVPGWMREAKLLDEALNNFDAASATAEKQPLIKDPTIDGSDSDTTKGGGVTSRRPLSKISTPVNLKTPRDKMY